MKKIIFNDLTIKNNRQRKKIDAAIAAVINSGVFVLGKEVKKFEKEFANFLGIKHCVGVGNGLEALQIALISLEIGDGDEVITTPISAVATTLAILAVGAKPVFVDTDVSGLIDSKAIPKAIGKKTKAIIPVHLYGQPARLDQLQKISKQNNLYLIEDAAQAHGTAYKGRRLGTFGNIGCFSFYPTKNLGALGDGGAIVTNNAKIAAICKQIRDYGQKQKYKHHTYGLNSRLDEIQAATLRVRLRFLNEGNKKRQLLAQRYCNKLSKLPLQIITPYSKNSNFHLFVIRTPQRRKLQGFLSQCGIQTLIHYPIIIPEQPFLKSQYDTSKLKTAKRVTNEVLSLPCYPDMNFRHVDYICKKIQEFFS